MFRLNSALVQTALVLKNDEWPDVPVDDERRLRSPVALTEFARTSPAASIVAA